jgi:hypothetical protein
LKYIKDFFMFLGGGGFFPLPALSFQMRDKAGDSDEDKNGNKQ